MLKTLTFPTNFDVYFQCIFYFLWLRLHQCGKVVAVQPAAGVGPLQGAGPGPGPEGHHQPGARHHAQSPQVPRHAAGAAFYCGPGSAVAGGQRFLRAAGGRATHRAASEPAESGAGGAQYVQHCSHTQPCVER